MKTLALLAVALLLASCVTSETTVTSPDGTVTTIKQTTLSGEGVATGAAAIATVTADK